MILKRDRWTTESRDQLPIDTIFYTTSVVNTPSRIEADIGLVRERLMEIALRPIRRKATETLDVIRLQDEARRREILNKPGSSPCDPPAADSRIGFVHEFRTLEEAEITELLNQGWVPAGVTLPNAVLAPDVIASLIRMSGGNFRLLTRLLTQIERILKVNNLDTVSKEIVAAARDSLVIGQV
jgi:hypothetical protein